MAPDTLYVRGESVFELDGDQLSSVYGVCVLREASTVFVRADETCINGAITLCGKQKFERIRVLGKATLVIKDDSRLETGCRLEVYAGSQIVAPCPLSRCSDHIMLLETMRRVPLYNDIVGR